VEEAVRVLHRRFRLEQASVELGKPFILEAEEPGRVKGPKPAKRVKKVIKRAKKPAKVKKAKKRR